MSSAWGDQKQGDKEEKEVFDDFHQEKFNRHKN